MIIIACVALHNFVRATNLPDIDFDNHHEEDELIADDDGGSAEVEPPLAFQMGDGLMNNIRDMITDSLWASSQ